MANPLQPDPSDEPLDMFEPEAPSRPAVSGESRRSAAELIPPRSVQPDDSTSVRVTVDLPPLASPGTGAVADLFRRPPAAAPAALAERSAPAYSDYSDLSVEVLGPPPPAGSVSFDHICSVKGLGFVEGVALIQGVCEAVQIAGPAAGVPELHGLYLTGSGEVVLHGPPTGEPPARELARLLHQLVEPNLMPPAGRLFVGRWVNDNAGGLTEFSSELAYFARPNKQELLASLHARCEGTARPQNQSATMRPERKQRKRPAPSDQASEPKRAVWLPVLLWLRSHRSEVAAAAAIIVVVAGAAAFVTWLWQRDTLPVTTAKTVVDVPADAVDARAPVKPPAPPAATRPDSAGRGRNGAPPPARISRSRTSTPPPAGSGNGAVPPAGEQGDGGNTDDPAPRAASAAVPPLPATTLPDLRIYSAADPGVEPPRLRSAPVLEVLLKGFEKRENQVELVVSERGDVQQARMIGAPQRIPDIMLLSRAKQLEFDPAVKDGVPVRYRIRLSWNVTP